MMIVWGPRTLRWFRNASEYTGYNKKLSEILLEHIPCRDSLCDMGCGAALIDFELAQHIENISCIDISPEAIDAVKSRVSELGTDNIHPICMDGTKATGSWSTVIALLHGGTAVIPKYLSLASDRLILVTHASLKGGFGPPGREGVRCFDLAGIRDYLDSNGYRYELVNAELEYGQPFPDLDDAREFVRAYSKPMSQEELDAYLEGSLVSTTDPRFPYYLPKTKKLGIFIIRRDQNENF